MSHKKKILLFVLLSLLCVLTSCSQKSNNPIPTTKSHIEEINTFFSSQDGIKVLASGWKFVKAYFSANIDEMKEMLLNEEIDSYKKSNVFNDLTYLNLDWNFCNVMSDNEVFLRYSFELENDSLAYIDVRLKKNNEEWKISSYLLEK